MQRVQSFSLDTYRWFETKQQPPNRLLLCFVCWSGFGIELFSQISLLAKRKWAPCGWFFASQGRERLMGDGGLFTGEQAHMRFIP